MQVSPQEPYWKFFIVLYYAARIVPTTNRLISVPVRIERINAPELMQLCKDMIPALGGTSDRVHL